MKNLSPDGIMQIETNTNEIQLNLNSGNYNFEIDYNKK